MRTTPTWIYVWVGLCIAPWFVLGFAVQWEARKQRKRAVMVWRVTRQTPFPPPSPFPPPEVP